MMEFQEKRRLKRLLYSKASLFILFILIIFIFIKVLDVYKKQGLAYDNLAKTAASLESLQAREKMLKDEIQKLKTEAGQEEEIREKYGFVKNGEELIMVVDEDQGKNPNPISTPINFWQKMLLWLR